ncbi:MAG: hypothetical protein HFI75_05830 [Lachnospiraceae bacterium]|nr:hypothetical protein [Lachnospiraceae bacterium]
MRKKTKNFVIVLLIFTLGITGCGKETKNAEKDISKSGQEEVEKEEKQEFEYEEREKGIVLTQYNGNSDKVEIPSEIEGKIVIGVEKTLFENCNRLTSVQFPACIESIQGGIFEKFSNVVIIGYENTKCEEVSQGEKRAFQSLGENPECIQYVDIYDSETKNVMNYTRLINGEKGKEGEYSEGAAFSVKEGVATLTLNNYNGGMIMAGGYGSLCIVLEEGSVNYIKAADKNIGINVFGNLTIQGNGSLSVKGGDLGSGQGIWTVGDLIIKDKVNLFVKSGDVESRQVYGIAAGLGTIKIIDAKVEIQTGMNNIAIIAGCNAHQEEGKIELEDCNIEEGGTVKDIRLATGGVEYYLGQSVAEESIEVSQTNGSLNGAADYIRISNERGAALETD